jgi:hydroxyacylglutathione hydrolase
MILSHSHIAHLTSHTLLIHSVSIRPSRLWPFVRLPRRGAAASATAHSRRTEAALSARLSVVTVPVLADNYAYVAYDQTTRRAAVVDAGDGDAVLSTVRELQLSVDRILCTHHHADHVGGVRQLRDAFPAAAVQATDERVAAATELVAHNHTTMLGPQIQIRTLLVPCHTRRSAAFVLSDVGDGKQKDADTANAGADADAHSAVFVGDTLFVGGCGRFFEGHAADLYSAMFDTLFALPPRTLMYCGHEYAEANLRFALSLEPDNGRVSEMAARVAARRDQRLPTVPQLLHDELLYNPFARCRERGIAKRLGFVEWSATDRNTHIAVLDQLRTMRNSFAA